MSKQSQSMDVGYMIKNYQMWKSEIGRLEHILYGERRSMSSWGVAQYGLEATMPKGSGIRSKSELERMDVRERKQLKRLERLQSYVYTLEMAFDLLEDEMLKTIYDCLLDGMTYRKIGEYLGVSKSFVQKKRSEIIRQIEQVLGEELAEPLHVKMT